MRKLKYILILFLIYGCTKPLIHKSLEYGVLGEFYVWVCPLDHQAYFTDYTFESGNYVSAEYFHTNNRGYFYKGVYQPIYWGKPLDGDRALCPICGNELIMSEQYFRRLR